MSLSACGGGKNVIDSLVPSIGSDTVVQCQCQSQCQLAFILSLTVEIFEMPKRSRPQVMPKRSRTSILVGSDCSGLGTDAIALDRLNVPFKICFASDTDRHCRNLLK